MPLPLFLAAGIWATFLTVIVPMVVRVLAALGIGYITISGMTALTDTGQAFIMANYQGIPSAALSLADIAGGTDALNIIFGSYAASLAIKTTLGAFSRFTTNSAWRT